MFLYIISVLDVKAGVLFLKLIFLFNQFVEFPFCGVKKCCTDPDPACMFFLMKYNKLYFEDLISVASEWKIKHF